MASHVSRTQWIGWFLRSAVGTCCKHGTMWSFYDILCKMTQFYHFDTQHPFDHDFPPRSHMVQHHTTCCVLLHVQWQFKVAVGTLCNWVMFVFLVVPKKVFLGLYTKLNLGYLLIHCSHAVCYDGAGLGHMFG